MTQPDNNNDLSVCVICERPAQFTDADPGANPVSYCSAHLPEHFRTRALSGQMPLKSGEDKDELYARAQELDIDGRSTMTKTQLETAVAAAIATQVARGDELGPDRRPIPVPDDGRPRDDDRPTPPAPRPPVRLTPEAEGVEQQYATEDSSPTNEGGEMSDAPTQTPEVHDHAVETVGDADEQPKKAAPRKASRKK